MTYHELIEKYKNRELSQDEQKKVEQDIERHEAISEYLFDREEECISRDSGEQNGSEEKKEHSSQAEREADEFATYVRRTVRRAFLKMGVIVGSVLLVLLLLILFVLPEVVSSFFYDPGEIVGENASGAATNQMSLDMAVYSELVMPGKYRDSVQVEDRGYGVYDVNIFQSVSRTGTFAHVAGTVERGRLNLYDLNQLTLPVGNAFGWFQMNAQSGKSLEELTAQGESQYFGAGGDPETVRDTLTKLDSGNYYTAYVTLNKVTAYEEFIRFLDSVKEKEVSDIWCAARTSETMQHMAGAPTVFGFYVDLGQSSLVSWDREAYPELVLWAEESDGESNWDEAREKIWDASFAAEHFAEMLDYMADQPDFLGMMEQAPERYASAADYVRENGVQVWGFACSATKEQLLDLYEMPEIFDIYVER